MTNVNVHEAIKEFEKYGHLTLVSGNTKLQLIGEYIEHDKEEVYYIITSKDAAHPDPKKWIKCTENWKEMITNFNFVKEIKNDKPK